MNRLGRISTVTAVRISSRSAIVGVAISGNLRPVAPLTKAARSRVIPTTREVKSTDICGALCCISELRYSNWQGIRTPCNIEFCKLQAISDDAILKPHGD